MLAGYVPLDGFGKNYEVTGIVRPEYRRQGIGSLLFEAVCQETRQREAQKLLLVNYKASFPGSEFVRAKKIPFEFSEYHMETVAANVPILPPGDLRLEQVHPEQATILADLIWQSFPRDGLRPEEMMARDLTEPGSRYFFGKVGNEIVGQLGVLEAEGEVYIRAVGIVAEKRGKGYGRQMSTVF